MLALIALVLKVLVMCLPASATEPVMVIPPMPDHAPYLPITEHDFAEDGVFDYCLCDECCNTQAVKEYEDEFTALFNSYEVKRAKNGALMIRRGNSGSYKFCKKG